jgi:transposase
LIPKTLQFIGFPPAKAELYGETYRFLVVHSNKLDGRKRKSIQSQLEKEQQSWEKAKEKLEKKDFACGADAKTALSEFLRTHRGSHTFEGAIVREDRPGKRKKRGRPRKDEASPSPVTVYRIQLDIQPPSEEHMERLRQQASTFILITNVTKKPALSDVDMLKGYKEQQTVENRFRFLKSPYFVGRVFLEKPQRVEAFAYVMMLSVMIYSLFEYLIRKRMEQEKEPLDLLGGSRTSFRPTGESVLEILDTIDIIHMEQEGKNIRLFPNNRKQQVERILGLIGLDTSIYTQPKGKKAVEKLSQ